MAGGVSGKVGRLGSGESGDIVEIGENGESGESGESGGGVGKYHSPPPLAVPPSLPFPVSEVSVVSHFPA